MALVGNISGSGGTYSTVGITGSVIFAYTDTPSAFPRLTDVGNDVVFFVSGSTTGKNGAIRNVAVFGGDAVVSGSLTIGSGSVKLTSNDIQFSDSGTRIERNGNNLKFFDASNTGGLTLSQLNSGGGGGGGDSFFSSTTNGSIFTTGSAIFRGPESQDSPADLGTDLFFYVSGSSSVGGSRPASGVSSFGGDLVVTGALYTGGNVSVGGDITSADGEEAKSIFVNVGPNNVTIGSTSGNVVIGNYLKVEGNQISGSAGGNITLQSGGDVEILGDLKINGNDVKGSGGTTAITLSGADVSIAGDLAVNGSTSADITTTTATATLFNANATTVNIGGAATSVFIGAPAGTVTIPGNLTVQGATTTIDTTNLLVEDPIIYFGSGSTTLNQEGGIALASGSSVTHQALVWGRVATNTWGAGRLDVQNGTVTNFTSLTNYLPVRASKFEVGGNVDATNNPQAFVSSSFGNDLILSGAAIVTVGSTAVNFQRGDSTYATLGGNAAGSGVTFAANTGRQLTIGTVGQAFNLSGSAIIANFASNGSTTFQRDGTPTVALNATLAADQPQLVASQNNGKFTIGTSGGTTDFLALSGSAVKVNTSAAQGFQVQRDGTQVLVISGTNDGAVLAARSVGATPSSLTLTMSGSLVTVGANTGTNFNIAGDRVASVLGDASSVTISTPKATASVFNVNATTVNAFGAATAINVGAANGTLTSNVSIVPGVNNSYDLGTPSLRWRNMYTGDLHLKNERGNWTIIEEREYLSITNNITGKRYKFVLQEIE